MANKNITTVNEISPSANTKVLIDENNVLNKTSLLEAIYPVGSVYISTVFTNPQDLFGFGTWTMLKDRFLLGAGNTFQIGTTGGEINHTLTINEMPSHRHSTQGYYTLPPITVGTDNTRHVISRSFISSDPVDSNPNMHLTGGNVAHNNMPPYLVVYMWKRDA